MNLNEQFLKTLLEYDFISCQKLANSKEFVDFVNSVKDRSNLFKQVLFKLLELEKNEEGYYLDAFGKQISFNGMKTLKKEGTKVKWTLLAENEYKKCAANFEYFFFNYCKIMTKRGYDYPELREYQLKAIEAMQNHDRLLISYSRQMGKTIVTAAYILWKTIFGRNTTHGIVGQVHKTAIEVLDKMKEILFGLPFIFIPGAKIFNRGTLYFDNKCRVLTATANGNAFRGFSIIGEEINDLPIPSGAVLYIDEEAYINQNDFKAFEDSVLATVSSVPNSQIFKSSTANGRNHWYFEVMGAKQNKFTYEKDEIIKEIGMTAEEAYNIGYNDAKHIIKIEKSDDKFIVHKHKGKNGYKIVEANYLDRFKGDEQGAQEFKARIIAEKDEVFFQQVHANEFLGSSYTLVSDKILETITPLPDEDIIRDSIFDGLRIFEEPKRSHNYIIGVDPKKEGIDSVGIQVLDVTSMPFKQVATAEINASFLVVPGRLFDLGNYYNKAMVVCENNIGESIPSTLFYNYEYEGEVFTEVDKNGKPKKEMGVRTTTKTKRLGLTLLKKLIEGQKLIINDKNTLEQLFVFIEHPNGSFSASDGNCDDLVMSLMVALAPFFDFRNFDNFKGFVEYLERKKKEQEQEEERFESFLDLGFSTDNINEGPPGFTPGVWDDDFYLQNNFRQEDFERY